MRHDGVGNTEGLHFRDQRQRPIPRMALLASSDRCRERFHVSDAETGGIFQ